MTTCTDTTFTQLKHGYQVAPLPEGARELTPSEVDMVAGGGVPGGTDGIPWYMEDFKEPRVPRLDENGHIHREWADWEADMQEMHEHNQRLERADTCSSLRQMSGELALATFGLIAASVAMVPVSVVAAGATTIFGAGTGLLSVMGYDAHSRVCDGDGEEEEDG